VFARALGGGDGVDEGFADAADVQELPLRR
jgi:hypothetical protein